MTSHLQVTKLLDVIVDKLDIPKSYYEKAANRHRSLGEWLCRSGSRLAAFQPNVSPQGSFRYGTVIQPLNSSCEYDLDNVTTLSISKTAMTQKQIKQLYGAEVAAYAKANGIEEPLEERSRCWRLIYSDEAAFHLDTLPCIPEEGQVIDQIASLGVPSILAALAIAITDKRHPRYEVVTQDLLSSNPRGFAMWFEEQTRPRALERMRKLVESGFYRSLESVPPYEWKTPLQRSIQLLKRHRDVMFKDNPNLGPISMIITNIAARAYGGETDIGSALTNIVERMPLFVRPERPRVPNPADPAEDYADKWSSDLRLEPNFWLWHEQAKSDIARLPGILASNRLCVEIQTMFEVSLGGDDLTPPAVRSTQTARSAPIVSIMSAPRPWGHEI